MRPNSMQLASPAINFQQATYCHSESASHYNVNSFEAYRRCAHLVVAAPLLAAANARQEGSMRTGIVAVLAAISIASVSAAANATQWAYVPPSNGSTCPAGSFYQ